MRGLVRLLRLPLAVQRPEHLERAIRLAKPALDLASIPLYDARGPQGEERIRARGLVLVDRFEETPEPGGSYRLGGRRLLLCRNRRLLEQLRQGWRRADGSYSWVAETVELTPAEALRRWGLADIARGVHDALRAAEKAQRGLLVKIQRSHGELDAMVAGADE